MMRISTCLLFACWGALWASSSEAAHLRGAAFADNFDNSSCDFMETLNPIAVTNRRETIHLVFSNFCVATRKRVGFQVTARAVDALDCTPAIGTPFHLTPTGFSGISCRVKQDALKNKYYYDVQSCVVTTGSKCVPANPQPLEIEIPMGPLEKPSGSGR